ncbi:MAG: hypothetical protein HZA31_11200 [Opitutae bacterium]|nr:hypothetical protein [Opitutae bacterium]
MKTPAIAVRHARALALVAFAATGFGAGRLSGAESAAESFVELPPLEVSAAIASPPPWQYAEAPGSEILSRCSATTTKKFAQAHHRIEQLFAAFVPREFQAQFAVPTLIILADKKTTPSVARDLIATQGTPETESTEASPQEGNPATRRPHSNTIRFLPNLRLYDVDAVAIYTIIDEEQFEPDELVLSFSYMCFLVERRTPPLPAWLCAGIVRLCAVAQFEPGALVFPPAGWVSAEEKAGLKNDPDFPRTLLSMRELLEAPSPPDADSDTALRWQAQTELFLRWVFEPDAPHRRAALWKLVARAGAEPVTEAMFREYFALSYSDMRDRLSDYLPVAIQAAMRVQPGKLTELPAPKLRLATGAEIGRMKGDWERLEISYVKTRYPHFVAKYEEQAQRTFAKAPALGAQDPRLFAVRALHACDQGNDQAARPLLETAAQAKVVRPRIYCELARLRLAEALAQPAGKQGALSLAQANRVLEPLARARTQSPPLAQAYELTAEVWSRSDVALGPQHLALMDEGLHLFPAQISLLYRVAVLKMAQGRGAEATALVERGLALNPGAGWKTRFDKLQALLAKAGQKSPAPAAK